MTTRPRILSSAGLLALAATTACSGATDGAGSTPTPSATGTPAAVASATPADAALTRHTCTADASGAWTFSGTLHNTGSSAATYTVVLSLVPKDGSKATTSHSLTRRVEGDASQEVTAARFATRKDSASLTCRVSTTATSSTDPTPGAGARRVIVSAQPTHSR